MSQLNEKKEFKKLADNATAYYASAYGHESGEYTFIPVAKCEVIYGFMYKGYQFQYDQHGYYIYDEDGCEIDNWLEYEKLEFERKFWNFLALEKILSDKVSELKEQK
jgi:DUF2075 family protein